MTLIIDDLQDFFVHAPTSWHAVEEMGNRLAFLDFTPLSMHEKWELEVGKKYFIIHEGSLAAFVLPKKKPTKLSIIGAHTDSPALKIKPLPEIRKHNMIQLGVEVYGSPILYTWANRDLGIAGRITTLGKKDQIEHHLVFIDDAPLIIPLLAPHLDREIYKKGFELSKQDHLVPIATLTEKDFPKNYLEELLHRQVVFHKLLDFDLFLVPLEQPRFLGNNGELLASYRIDNLSSSHAALVAMGNISKAPNHNLPIVLFWDHEEIGSETNVGAHSPFFADILKRITAFYKFNAEDEVMLRNNSLCLSVDVAHAVNPNYENKYDPNHLPLLGKGIVLKYNANMRYCTNSNSTGQILKLLDQCKLKFQRFVNRSDTAGGSTIGPVFASSLGIATLDIGIAELSMHAAREVLCCQDYIDLCTLLTQFLQEGDLDS